MKQLLIILALLTPTLAISEVAIYKGLVTTHSVGNEYLNNNNNVTMIQVDNVIAGYMINSYNERGILVGLQKDMFTISKVTVSSGTVVVTGYRREQIPYINNISDERKKQQILVIMPIVSITYNINDTVGLRLNNVGAIIWNAGIIIKFGE